MHALLLIVSVLMNILSAGILRNDFCKKEIHGSADLHTFNALSSILSAVTLAVIALAGGSLCIPSLYTLGLGVVFGVITALCAVLAMKALESGPLSYTNVIIACGMVIPSLSGMVFFGESISIGQYFGMALMLISIACAVDTSNKESGMSLRWLLLCLGSFLCSGSVGVMQKLHQSSPHRDELGIFLVIAFIVSALFSFAAARISLNKGGKVTVLAAGRVRKLVIFSIVCGIGIALCNQINMYLAGVMEAVIFYPVVNGGFMLLNILAGVLLWHEKLSRRQWFGLIMGGAAIFLLCGIL